MSQYFAEIIKSNQQFFLMIIWIFGRNFLDCIFWTAFFGLQLQNFIFTKNSFFGLQLQNFIFTKNSFFDQNFIFTKNSFYFFDQNFIFLTKIFANSRFCCIQSAKSGQSSGAPRGNGDVLKIN